MATTTGRFSQKQRWLSTLQFVVNPLDLDRQKPKKRVLGVIRQRGKTLVFQKRLPLTSGKRITREEFTNK